MSSAIHLIQRYKIHWHVLLIHFPISFFVAAFGAQILHLFISPACFELATNVAIAAGVITLIPTTLSGWSSWKNNYKGTKITLFRRKITISFVMLGISVPLIIWRSFALSFLEEAPESPAHWIVFFGTTLLIGGAIAEGYYGGRLHHR